MVLHPSTLSSCSTVNLHYRQRREVRAICGTHSFSCSNMDAICSKRASAARRERSSRRAESWKVAQKISWARKGASARKAVIGRRRILQTSEYKSLAVDVPSLHRNPRRDRMLASMSLSTSIDSSVRFDPLSSLTVRERSTLKALHSLSTYTDLTSERRSTPASTSSEQNDSFEEAYSFQSILNLSVSHTNAPSTSQTPYDFSSSATNSDTLATMSSLDTSHSSPYPSSFLDTSSSSYLSY